MARASVLRRITAAAIPLAIVAASLVAAPAYAASPSTPPFVEPHPAGAATEMTVVGLGLPGSLYGGFVPSVTATTPYPSSGLEDQRSFTTAQILLEDPVSGEQVTTYCIDIETDTTLGVHYELGTWTEANVPNLPYVQWILNNYPITPGPTPEEVRAVQGAIWYFTDQFVVNRHYPTERNAVRSIVQAAQAALAGGLPPAPPLPSVTVSPEAASAVPGDITGPYTVSTANLTSEATIDFGADVEVFRSANGSLPVPRGSAVADGEQFWVRFDASAVDPGFTVSGSGTAPAGNVYLYDDGNPPRTSAQKLVLAAEAVVPARAQLRLTPEPAGTLEVDVEIAGAAAGRQGLVGLEVSCNAPGWSTTQPAYRVANAPAGPAVTVATIPGIPVGAECIVTRTADGQNPYAQFDDGDSSISPVPAVIVADAVTAVLVRNVYDVPVPPTGSLQVDVDVTGPAAGLQSELELAVTCVAGADDDVVSRTIEVDAGIVGESTVATLADLPAGAECSVVQTDDGSDDRAQLDTALSSIEPAVAVIADGGTAEILVSNFYRSPEPTTGTLAVDLTVSGAAAGAQSEIRLLAVCTIDGDIDTSEIDVAAGTTGTTRVAEIDSIPVGSQCSIEQPEDGANADAVFGAAASSITPASVTVVEEATVVVTVSDVFLAPTPTPTPTPTSTPSPTHTALPATGSDGAGPWPLGILALVVGAALVAGDVLRRRAKKA